jgi:uncharacterized protein YaeQ
MAAIGSGSSLSRSSRPPAVMHPERREYRLTFSNVDRHQSHNRSVVLSRHPTESPAHLTLRVLAFVLLYEEGLTFGTGVCAADDPDLVTHSLTGKVSTWVACGDISPEMARKIVQHNRDATIHIVFGSRARRDAFFAGVESWGTQRPRGWERLSLWTLDEALIRCLAAHEQLRQSWTVTIVGEHVYADADGTLCEGPVVRG